MKNLFFLLSAVLWMAIPITAMGQFSVTHDSPNTTTTPQYAPLILSDGSVVTWHHLQGMHRFRKYDDTGLLIWSVECPGSYFEGLFGAARFSMIRDNGNGFIVAEHAGTTYDYITDTIWGEPSLDVEHTFRIIHFDDEGAITNSFQLKKSYLISSSYYDHIDHIDLGFTPVGEYVLMAQYNVLTWPSTDVIKMDISGNVIWSRNIGPNPSTWPDAPLPTYSMEMSPIGRIAIGQDGQLYFTDKGTFMSSHLRVMQLDGNGDLSWVKRYVYGNNVSSIAYDDIHVDPDGRVHAAGTLVTTVGRFHIFLIMSSIGDLQRADIYRSPYYLMNGGFGLDEEGRRYHRVSTNTDMMEPDYSQAILQADTLGSPALYMRRDDQIVLPNNVFIPFQNMDVNGDKVAVSGSMHHEHVDLAFTTRYESLMVFDTENLFYCFSNDTTLTHIEVPLNIMTTEDITNYASVDVAQFYSSTADNTVLSTLPMQPLEELCDFGYNLLGVQIGVSEFSSGEQRPLVRQTLLTAGDAIILETTEARSVQVWTINGSLKHAASIVGEPPVITTSNWSSGVYLVRALDGMGRPIGTQRVVLE